MNQYLLYVWEEESFSLTENPHRDFLSFPWEWDEEEEEEREEEEEEDE